MYYVYDVRRYDVRYSSREKNHRNPSWHLFSVLSTFDDSTGVASRCTHSIQNVFPACLGGNATPCNARISQMGRVTLPYLQANPPLGNARNNMQCRTTASPLLVSETKVPHIHEKNTGSRRIIEPGTKCSDELMNYIIYYCEKMYSVSFVTLHIGIFHYAISVQWDYRSTSYISRCT